MSLKYSTKISLSTWKKIKLSTVKLGSSSETSLSQLWRLSLLNSIFKIPIKYFILLEILWIYKRELCDWYDVSNLTGDLGIFLRKKLFNILPRRRKPRPNHQVSFTQNISQFQKRSYIFLGFWNSYTTSFILEAISYLVPA